MPSIFYFDASALVKRYKDEKGSEAVNKIFEFHDRIESLLFTARLTIVEIGSVGMRLQRNGVISLDEAHNMYYTFQMESKSQLIFLDVNSQIETNAINIMSQNPLKASDAIQLSTALDLHLIYCDDFYFVSSDKQLNNAAQSVGMNSINPVDEGALNTLESL